MNETDTYNSLVDEWRALIANASASTAHWEQSLRSIEREEDALRAAGQWVHGRADLLAVIGKHRDELVHSRMIGWLLDPCGHHGLGANVLRLLLEHTSIPCADPAALARARIRLEVPVDQGRIDIVVEAPCLYLVVENKVDAQEGDGQCAYYAERVTHPARHFIYLTPDGRSPRDAPEFRTVSYKALAGILRSALSVDSAESGGRVVASEYLRTLQLEFL